MVDLLIANIVDETTDDEIRDFLVKYGFPLFDDIQKVPGTGSRPGVLVTFNGLDAATLRNLKGRIHNIVWKGHSITARIMREHDTD